MKLRRIVAIFLCLIIALLTPIAAFADEGALDGATNETTEEATNEATYESNDEIISEPTNEASSEAGSETGDSATFAWTAEDFTYGDYSKDLESIKGDHLIITGKAITGFSESGEAKLAGNKELELPAVDSEGNTLVGVADKAFTSKGITSLKINAAGNYVIGKDAFKQNELTSLDLPENVIACDTNSFYNNKLTEVTFSKSIWCLENQAFARNLITTVNFPKTVDRPLQMHGAVFSANFIKSVRIPDNTEVINKAVFLLNPGMEDFPSDMPEKLQKSYSPKTYGDTTYGPNGVVHMYTTNKDLQSNGNICTIDSTDTSKKTYVQKIVVKADDPIDPGTGEDDEDDGKPVEWTSADFTYGEYEKLLYGCDYSRQFTVKGIAVTGLSESGEKKLKKSTDLVLPSRDTEGNILVGVGPKAFEKRGLTSVTFPTGMMIDYDDTVTNVVTKRGNYVIAEDAFAGNKLTEVYLPSGVIAVLANAFMGNEITTVTLPKTIWWIENMSFARNLIETVNFPKTTDFSLEFHGMTFAGNKIKSVRLPDFTEVVNKDAFDWNPGMEALADGTPKAYSRLADKTTGRVYENCGVVYMYTGNKKLYDKDRIHTTERATRSQHSYVQKLVLDETTYGAWNQDDFTYDKNDPSVITGLSESGIAKRATTTRLVLPDKHNGKYITAIANAKPEAGGMFSTDTEKFEHVDLPQKLKSIGENVFRESGLKDIQFPETLESIGSAAFQTNELKSVILPDSLVTLGDGAFATNPDLERIVLSRNMTEIARAAFGCSDKYNYMTKLESIEIPEGIEIIADRAFAGNNFHEIKLPSTVKTIGDYAFSTKNYLKEPCTVTLNEGLETIGDSAFRNKCIESIQMPSTLKSMGVKTFLKAYSDNSEPMVTAVYLPTQKQFDDRTNFPENDKYHKFYLLDAKQWSASDFTFEVAGSTAKVTGFSESGVMKYALNPSLAIPSTDGNGNPVTAIGSGAFANRRITFVTLPETVTSIEANAFSGNKIREVQLPKVIETVDGTAFEDNNCTVQMYLDKSVEAPAGVIQNDHQTLVAGILDEVPTSWDPEDFTYNEATGTITGWSDSGNTKRLKLKTLVIPEKTPGGKPIVAVGEEAFAIPADELVVTKFGIESPNGMTSVTMPKTVKKVAKRAFAGNSLTVVDLGGLESIGESAFYGNKLIEAMLPDSVSELGAGAFANNNITKLRLSKNVTVIPQGAFSMNIRLSHVDIPNTVTEIGKMAFAGARLEKLTIPKSVEKIGVKAFHLHHLTELTIPGNVKVVEDMAFEGTFKATTLKKLTIEEGVESIGKYAFKEALLEETTFPSSLKTLGDEPFYNNKGYKGSHVVQVTTSNLEHMKLEDPTYTVRFFKRVAGSTRYDTAIQAAETLKEVNAFTDGTTTTGAGATTGDAASTGNAKFKNIVVACGSNYPDALSGSYLAKVKEAPVLLVDAKTEGTIKKYIESNIEAGGTVYILGSASVVSKRFENSLASVEDLKVERLGGATRYDTNIEILKAAGVADEDLLICTATGYADSLSASATGRPILLVGNTLTESQKRYVESLGTTKAYAIGSNQVVSDKVLKEYKSVTGIEATRIAGSTRYSTSVEVAKTFFGTESVDYAVLAYAQNFPDGLSGAPIAIGMNAPILLVSGDGGVGGSGSKEAKAYCNNAGVRGIFVLGSNTLVNDKIAYSMFK